MLLLISTVFLLLISAMLFAVICMALGELFAWMLRPFYRRL